MSFMIRLGMFFTLCVASMVTLWIGFTDFSFDFTGVPKYLFGIITMSVIAWLFRKYTTIPLVHKLSVLMVWFIVLHLYITVGAPSSYLFASVGGAFVDPYFAAADKALGLDWVAFLEFVANYPWIGDYSTSIYLSSMKVLLTTMLLLALLGKHEQGDLLIVSVMISAFVTSALSAPFTASGPFGFYNVPVDVYKELAPAVTGKGGIWLDHLLQLRSGEFRELRQGIYQGVVQFPSFHTTLSVLLILSMRGTGPFFWLASFYNVLILLTVPIDGGHYFVDLIAGALVALIVWYGLAALNQWVTQNKKFSVAIPVFPAYITRAIAGRLARQTEQFYARWAPRFPLGK